MSKINRSSERAHIGEKLPTCPGLAEFINEQFHGLNRRQRIQYLAQHPNALQVVFRNQQLFLARARTLNVDGGEHTLVDQLPLQDDLGITRSLKFLEDHVIHSRPGVDESGGDNGE